MIAKSVSLKYSRALADVAKNSEQMEKHLIGLDQFLEALQSIPTLKEILFDPHLSTRHKKSILRRLFDQRLDEILLNFLFILIEKGRFKYIADIRKEYRRLAKKRLGILEARLITAIPVDTRLKDKIQQKLQTTYQKKVEIQTIVNPDIIGGMILAVDHYLLNDSMKERLTKLKASLLTAKV
jgi:F-type H+-transporting ATPase subunit delta